MFGNHRVYATIPALDIDRAKAWYREKLGLKPTMTTPGGVGYELAGGTAFLLYQTQHAGKAPNTLMTFETNDVEGDVAALKKKGVGFEEIDEGGIKTVNSIASMGGLKAAWFRDSEGNILALGNRPDQT